MTTTTHKLLLALAVLAACGGSQVEPPGDESTTDEATSSPTGGSDETGEPCVEDPEEPVELLNACSDATCEPFANTRERLPLLADDGSLPPLP